MKINLSILSFCLIISIGLHAQNDLTLNEVMGSAFPTSLTSSAYSDDIAWVENREGVRNIYLYNEEVKTIQLTDFQNDDGQAVGNLSFCPENDFVYFIRGGAPNRAGEIPNPRSHVEKAKREIWRIGIMEKDLELVGEGYGYQISPDGKSIVFINKGSAFILDTKELGKPSPLFSIRGSLGSLGWSPDNKHISFVSNRGTHSYIGVYSMDSKEINYLNPSVDYDGNPIWSPGGKQIAFTKVPRQSQNLPFMPRREALPWSIHIADLETGNVTQIWKAKAGAGSAFRFISADHQIFWTGGNRIVFPYEGQGWTHLWSISSEGGEAKNLTPGNFEVQFAHLSHDRNTLYYSSNQGDMDRQHIWRVDPKGGPAQLVTMGKGIEWSPVSTSERKYLFCLASEGKKPAYVAKVEKGTLSAVGSGTYDFPESKLVEPEQIIFTSVDGMKIHGQLFKPQSIKEGEKLPAVLFFHGGSRRQMLLGFHHRGYYHNSYAFNQFLASKGYIVLSVNYRSGIGYGMKFREALNYGARGASEFQDVLGGGIYLANRDDVDEDRIGLWGGSYGGYLTAMGLAKASDLFAAGVDIHGVHDWNVVIRNFAGAYDPVKRQEVAKLAFDSSPMAYIKDWKSPVLLIHGDDDRNVPFSETVDLVESLRRNDVYFEQLIFPDEVHGFLLHANWMSAFKASYDFFERKLKIKE